MIDSHCHLDHEPLLSNLDDVIKRSKDIGLNKILTICTTLESFNKIKQTGTDGQIKIWDAVHEQGDLKTEWIVKEVDTTSIGFQIGPRINAIGRLADSNTALNLLLAEDEVIKSAMPDEMYKVFHWYKNDEWEKFLGATTQWDLDTYLDCLP